MPTTPESCSQIFWLGCNRLNWWQQIYQLVTFLSVTNLTSFSLLTSVCKYFSALAVWRAILTLFSQGNFSFPLESFRSALSKSLAILGYMRQQGFLSRVTSLTLKGNTNNIIRLQHQNHLVHIACESHLRTLGFYSYKKCIKVQLSTSNLL